jgi:hypothetical protein
MFSVSINVADFAEKINVNVATVVRAAATELWGKVILRSPVDTGYFRRNWAISVDIPVTDTVGEPPPKGTVLPPPAMPEIEPGALHVWLVNNCAYAERLEAGSSRQAPNGMVAISVAELEAGMEAVDVSI